MSFRRQFSHLCVERFPAAAAAAAGGGGGVSVVPARHQRLRVDDELSTTDIYGLSNLRLSSSAPSTSYIGSCRSPVRARPPSPRRAACDDRSRSVAAGGLPFPVRVLNNLYLGDAATARDLECLRRHNIQYIVNVTADVENAFEDDSTLMYMRIAITDHWSETPTSFFTSAINFIGLFLQCLLASNSTLSTGQAFNNILHYYMELYAAEVNPDIHFVSTKGSNVFVPQKIRIVFFGRTT